MAKLITIDFYAHKIEMKFNSIMNRKLFKFVVILTFILHCAKFDKHFSHCNLQLLNKLIKYFSIEISKNFTTSKNRNRLIKLIMNMNCALERFHCDMLIARQFNPEFHSLKKNL